MDQKFNFTKLDERTRKLMLEEITNAQKTSQLYYSARFNDAGSQNWVNWFQAAATQYDEHWLAYQIEVNGAMKHLENRIKPKGGYTLAHVPDTAAETLAEGQFNRFYMAAICRRALEDSMTSVKIYRAKQCVEPRPESKAIEGTQRDANILLNELRNKDLSLKSELLKPNSGLSIDY